MGACDSLSVSESLAVAAKSAKMSNMADLDTPLPPATLAHVTATEAKNSLGAVLDRVMAEGRLAITRHDEVKAVLLSAREYEALVERRHDPLQALTEQFDGLLESMQQAAARKAGEALFDASSADLGRAAVRAARRRRRG